MKNIFSFMMVVALLSLTALSTPATAGTLRRWKVQGSYTRKTTKRICRIRYIYRYVYDRAQKKYVNKKYPRRIYARIPYAQVVPVTIIVSAANSKSAKTMVLRKMPGYNRKITKIVQVK